MKFETASDFQIRKAIIKNFAVPFCALMFTLGTSNNVYSQTLEEAREMIKAGNYSAAKDAFSVLIKKNANRADVNKWYGEALYETGNYAEAEKYLKFAANKRIQGAYLYLGKLYQKQYEFEKAVTNLEKYQTFLKKDPEQSLVVDTIIEQCEMGLRGISRIEKVQIVDSLIVDKNKFFQYYKLSQETGKLIDYKLLGVADPGELAVGFESQRGDQRVFAMKNGNSGMDLFKSTKLHGDSWSEPVIFPEGINSAANENFPFVLTDGLTIYYSSDSYPTLGGYDLYVSKFNSSNDTYFTPERLSMPFNSPFNDYLYAIDEENNVGWFASDRYQPEDKVVIYLFIPGPEEKEYYNELTPEQSIRFAKISSIFETWPENANYDSLLHSIYQAENTANDKKGEFIFVINDKIIYYNYDDFESKEALEQFKKYFSANNQLTDTNKELEELRLKWTKSNNKEKESLKSKILQLESRKSNLDEQVPELEVQARNTEINFLKKK
ncbi:MAG: hypothetical protein Q4F97_00920 [Bacteroidales bacterium]|nr:hypothetical protein [Bacteroidales bacterium]